MSYILEALRKAEQLRRRGGVPGIDALQAPQETTAGSPWTARIWIALIGVNVLLFALLFWHLIERPRNVVDEEPVTASTTARDAHDEAMPDLKRPAIVSAETDQQATPAVVEAKPVTPMPLRPIPPPPRVIAKPHGTVTYAPLETTAEDLTPNVDASPPQAAPPAAAVPEPAATDDLPTWPQVPPALFAQLQDSLRLDVHVYANNPSERFVLVNLQKYREGETLREGPLLEAITPEGIVLSFRGQRFRMLAK